MLPSSSEGLGCTSLDLKSHSLKLREKIGDAIFQGTLHGNKDGHTHAIVARKLRISNRSEELKKTVDLLKKASGRCSNVSVLHDVGMDGDYLWVIMNFYNMSLSQRIPSLDLKDTLRMAEDIARGTLDLLNVGCKCVDIDPNSILIDHKDTAYVTCLKDDAIINKYMAPEIWINPSTKTEKSEEYVSWSLGCVFYEMFTGHHLWNGMDEGEVESFMKKQELPALLKGKFSSPQLDKIISSCLNFEASQRPILSELLPLLECHDDECGSLTWSSINWAKIPNKTLPEMEEELNACLSNDNVENLRMLLEVARKDDVLHILLDRKDLHGNSLLHLACKQGSPNCTQELINSGADAETLDGDGQNLLHMMASWRDRDVSVGIDIMQKHKLDMSLLNNRKLTPLHLWIKAFKIDLIVEWIKRTNNQDHRKETIDILGSAGTSLCMAMVASPNETEAIKLVSVLLTAGADPAIGDHTGLTPLHIAVMEDDADLAKIILEGRTQLKDIKTDHGSPLQLALKKGAVNCLDLLLGLADEKDIKFQDEDKEGNTMIHVAARGSHTSFFVKFDTHISDYALKKKNHRGETPLSFLQYIPARLKKQLSPRLRDLLDLEKKKSFEPYSFGPEDMAGGLKVRRGGTRKVSATAPVDISELQDAANAGGRDSKECTLIITEGESAGSFARIGINNVLGRELYGVYALQGKPQNIKEDYQFNNTIYTGLTIALGLNQEDQFDIEANLRYGHVMFLTDQDPDGLHIKGLLIHFFAQRFPELLKMSTFFQDFTTPLICGTNNNTGEVKLFKSTNEFEKFYINETKRDEWSIEYCKGLASHEVHATVQYFKDYKKHVRNFFWSPGDDKWITLAFDKDMADRRKTLITRYKEGSIPDFDEKNVSYTQLFSEEIILYFVTDVQRSIPSAIDGLKTSERKVIFELLTSFSGGENVRISSLSGRVIERTAYNHGPQNLDKLITRMTKTERNNINLIQQGVGSRSKISKISQGFTRMKDPPARYLSARISPLTPYLFPKDDDVLLDYVQANGKSVEPRRFVPVVPLILINGCMAIASGYDSRVPPHKPKDVINNIFRLLEKKEAREMTPWYRGFKGNISRVSRTEYIARGLFTCSGNDELHVTQIPLHITRDEYTLILKRLKDRAEIKDFTEATFKGDPAIKVTFSSPLDFSTPNKKSDLMKMLVLETAIHQNLNLLNAQGHLICYQDTLEVLEHFYVERLRLYSKRKELRISQIESEMKTIRARLKTNGAQDSPGEYLELIGLKDHMKKLSSEVEDLQAADIEVQWWKKDLMAFEKALEVHGLSED